MLLYDQKEKESKNPFNMLKSKNNARGDTKELTELKKSLNNSSAV